MVLDECAHDSSLRTFGFGISDLGLEFNLDLYSDFDLDLDLDLD